MSILGFALAVAIVACGLLLVLCGGHLLMELTDDWLISRRHRRWERERKGGER